MIAFINNSLRHKLTLIILFVSVVAVIVSTITITIVGYSSLHNKLLEEHITLTSVIGSQNRPSLQFKDPLNAQQNLNALSTSPNVIQACLYNDSSTLFAQYQRSNSNHQCPAAPQPLERGSYYADERLLSFEPILSNNIFRNPFGDIPESDSKTPIGYIYIESDLLQIDNFLTQQFTISIMVVIFALLGSYLLAAMLQRTISKPVLTLSDVAKKVSMHKDYSLRVFINDKERLPDELITLVQSFNTMLIEIEDRDKRLRKKNEELASAKESAETANLSKSQFLANISHELRTPLNAIIGFSSIIMNQLFGQLNEQKYLEYATDIHESGIHLLDIINDILDLSKAEAGKLTLDLESFVVDVAIQKCINILAERAKEGGVIVNADIPHDTPKLVADRVRFIQIMLNIISNAIKFTHAGGKVDIHVHTKEANNGIHYFTFTVEDTGIGMAEDDIRKAFTSFGQVDSGLNRKYEGTGLGLPLTKKLVDLHNATIDINSTVGEGTKVQLRFISDPNVIK